MRIRFKWIGLFAGLAFLSAPFPVNATVLWDWSFNGEAGTFLTDGTASGNVAAPGAYALLDFSVTSSTAGAGLGSLASGYQLIGILSPAPVVYFGPTAFDWGGSSVTNWHRAGSDDA